MQVRTSCVAASCCKHCCYVLPCATCLSMVKLLLGCYCSMFLPGVNMLSACLPSCLAVVQRLRRERRQRLRLMRSVARPRSHTQQGLGCRQPACQTC